MAPLFDEEMMSEFLAECYENLDQVERDLVTLEKEPTSKDTIASIFRNIHTIKGASGFLGLNKLESVAHKGENLLAILRDGKMAVTSEIISVLLTLMDALRKIVNNVETTKKEGDEDYSDLIETLVSLQQGKQTKSPSPEPPQAPPAPETKQEPTPEPKLEPVSTPASDAPAPPEAHAPSVADASIRVNVSLLDKLMNLVGELVLARNQILQYTSNLEDVSFLRTSQRLNLITTELQEGVMKTRMQPINNVWSKFPRVVRDLAKACGKKINVSMEGKETELDKTLIEAIKDPLTHIVRNSADHGIETPAIREKSGKPAEGNLNLRAFHEGGQVNIEISDDGQGMDPDKIKAKVLQKNLMTQAQISKLTDREVLNLIYLPGFSTAEKVSNVSGRGVGMDVVKTNIEKIGGSVDLQSQKGKGTTIRIKIPLTLAIIPALIVTSGGDCYAIPQVSLLELVRLEDQGTEKGIEMVDNAPVYRLRGNLLPLIYLNKELDIEKNGIPKGPTNIVVLQAEDRPFGLVVDEVNDTQEIVVKPMGKQLKGISSFAGATIMGDGKVALILDVLGMAQKASVLSHGGHKAHLDRDRFVSEIRGERQALLLFKGPEERNMAIPLSLVARLEEFPASTIERSGHKEVVQYRDQIMPLIRLGSLSVPHGEQDKVHVVVYSYKGRNIGVVVDQIMDIVEDNFAIEKIAGQGDLMGTVVVHGHVTDLLDIKNMIRSSDPSFFEEVDADQVNIAA